MDTWRFQLSFSRALKNEGESIHVPEADDSDREECAYNLIVDFMMTDVEKEMIGRRRIILSGPLGYCSHYLISITFSFMALGLLIPAWSQIQSDRLLGQMSWGTLVFVGIIWVCVLAFWLIQYGGLKLEKETLDLEKEEIYEVLNEIGQQLNWTIISATEDVIVADSVRLFKASNRITIFLDGKDIYINSRSIGPELSLFRQGKLTDDLRGALRRRYFEIQHQKNLRTQTSFLAT